MLIQVLKLLLSLTSIGQFLLVIVRSIVRIGKRACKRGDGSSTSSVNSKINKIEAGKKGQVSLSMMSSDLRESGEQLLNC